MNINSDVFGDVGPVDPEESILAMLRGRPAIGRRLPMPSPEPEPPTVGFPALGRTADRGGLFGGAEPRQPEVTLGNLGDATLPQIREKESQLAAAYKPSLWRRILGGTAETLGAMRGRPMLVQLGQRLERGPLAKQLAPYEAQAGQLQSEQDAGDAALKRQQAAATLAETQARTQKLLEPKPTPEKTATPQEQAFTYLLTTKNPTTGKNLTPQEAYEALQRPSTQQPNELALWLKAHPGKNIDDYMRVQANLKPEFPRIQPVNDAQGNTIGYATFTGTAAGVRAGFVPASEIPGLSRATGAGVIPPKPTSTTLTMSQMAKTISPQIEQLDRQIDDTAAALGPLAGRWNRVMVGKVGADNPKVAALLSNIDAMASALTRTHFGARGGQEYIKALRESLKLAQSPGDLKARLAAWATWVNAYASMTGGAQPKAAQAPTGQRDLGAAPAGKKDGDTGTLPDGTRVTVQNGRLVAQ